MRDLRDLLGQHGFGCLMGGGRRQGHGVTPGHLIHNFFFFCMQAGRMAVARQGGWATQGAAEGMQLETLELDESMRGDDGVKGDVRGTCCTRLWACVPLSMRSGCTVH